MVEPHTLQKFQINGNYVKFVNTWSGCWRKLHNSWFVHLTKYYRV